MSEARPFDAEKDASFNREPGIVIIPGSNYAKEMQKFEQFPGKYGADPGNPYTYRPYPKMLYRAQHRHGVVACMAAPPDSLEFKDGREYERAAESAQKFTDACQRIVNDESEQSRAAEDGWREFPAEAVKVLQARDETVSRATAERNYADRNLGELAKREVAEAVAAVGGEHVPTIPEKRRPGRPRTNFA